MIQNGLFVRLSGRWSRSRWFSALHDITAQFRLCWGGDFSMGRNREILSKRSVNVYLKAEFRVVFLLSKTALLKVSLLKVTLTGWITKRKRGINTSHSSGVEALKHPHALTSRVPLFNRPRMTIEFFANGQEDPLSAFYLAGHSVSRPILSQRFIGFKELFLFSIWKEAQ